MALIRLGVGDVLEINFPGPTQVVQIRMKRVSRDTVLYDVSAPPYVSITKFEDRYEPSSMPGKIQLSAPPKGGAMEA